MSRRSTAEYESHDGSPRRGLDRLSTLIAAALTVIVLAGVVTVVHRQWTAHPPEQCQARGSKPVSSGSPTAVVLGDSYTAGLGLHDPKLAWSTLLGRLEGWRTYAEAVSGTGFTTDGPCEGQDYASRLPKALAHHPQVLVIQGGLNDAYSPRDSRSAGLTRLLDRSSKVPRVIVVGPPAAPRVRKPALQRVDEELRAACRPPRCTYVSTLGWELRFAPDQLHLTAVGHLQFAVRVSGALHGRS